MSRTTLATLVAALLALALAACGSGDDDGGDGEAAGDAAQTVEISGTEFALDPEVVELEEAGSYTFVFRNDGGTVHALEVEGHDMEEETEEIEAGETAELTVDLTQDGEYEMYCPVGNHRDQGMEGTIHVGGAGQTDTHGTTTDETTTEDDDSDTDY